MYTKLREILYTYLNTEDIITDHTLLVKETQKLFDYITIRARFEAGITPVVDKKIRKMIEQQKKGNK